jgi:hypothetical protein
MSLLTELCPLVDGDATNMPALTGLENLCSIRVSSVAENSNARCLRLSTPNCHWPHGWDLAGERARPGGRFRRRAASPENSPAIYGWDSLPAIVQSPVRDERIFLPSLAGLFHLIDAIPSHEWLGYCQCVAPRLRRLRALRTAKIQPPFAPVRPPQTAIGRPAGTWLGSAPVPVAVSGVVPSPAPLGAAYL